MSHNDREVYTYLLEIYGIKNLYYITEKDLLLMWERGRFYEHRFSFSCSFIVCNFCFSGFLLCKREVHGDLGNIPLNYLGGNKYLLSMHE